VIKLVHKSVNQIPLTAADGTLAGMPGYWGVNAVFAPGWQERTFQMLKGLRPAKGVI
jgi:hypothetical protein